MQSINFEFLRARRPELADLGALAEQYAPLDPSSALVKLRSFCERVVFSIYRALGLPKPIQPNLNDLLNETAFKTAVPRVVVSKFHTLRIQGNKAAHGEEMNAPTAIWVLQEAFDIARWLHQAYDRGAASDCAAFNSSFATPQESREQLKREKKDVLEKLAAQEVQMQQLLGDLEAANARLQVAVRTQAELDALRQASQQAADQLQFDERTTRRRLIDSLLKSAGWKVADNGASTDEVGQEVDVLHQATASGAGAADYVLWDDNAKPLAVIEAKKTVLDAEQGRTQAKLYADGLQKTHGQRPVIFYTNGYDIYIWDDAQGQPPRKIFGFYSKDSLQYRVFQRTNCVELRTIAPSPEIAGRLYQIEAIKRVLERFAQKHRKALIVQATGTGKTRVAISLCDALVRAKWAKRILFLCDRRELRKQALNVFKDFLPGEPRVVVDRTTANDRNQRIYLATYPAMMQIFESFDVGFFDLIIADESHRSIYNRYRDLFLYFDCLQVGLTATPVKALIGANTYRMFGCEDKDPTAFFGYEDAINHTPPYLVPFEVETFTTDFMTRGIKYSQMSDDQKRQLEEDEAVPALVEYDADQIDKHIFNKDTLRHVIRNLMEHGIRNATGNRLGKTIVFARNHNHAVMLRKTFDELYPQYGGKLCQVIDNYDPRAEELIDEFKQKERESISDLTIAISVDMLDTGIDIPEVVNLVFAKPVYSFVKFWQMIGRGTRLCENLFGPGKHKSCFRIFDHWGNFEFFDQEYTEREAREPKSLLQLLFESRIQLAEEAQAANDNAAFDLAAHLIAQDIADLPETSISVKEKWREVRAFRAAGALTHLDAVTLGTLRNEIAPLMQWRGVEKFDQAFQFDNLAAKLQVERLRRSARFDNLKDELKQQVAEVPTNLYGVRPVVPTIEKVRTGEFWQNATVADIETVRTELRGVMKYRQSNTGPSTGPKVVDVKEDAGSIQRRAYQIQRLEGLQLAAYRLRVDKILNDILNENPTLQKIKQGQPVGENDLKELVEKVLLRDPEVNLNDLLVHFPETAGHLDQAIRRVIGMDGAAVSQHFTQFVHAHPNLTAHQVKFLSLLQNHISKYGSITVERLYEAPFTTLHSEGLDGVFPEQEQANELVALIETFKN